MQPDLATLRGVITASSQAIPYENLDVLLGQPPQLDIASLQKQMVTDRRGGFCFQQALLLRAGLRAMGFAATAMLGRVVLGLAPDAARLAGHGAVRIDLPEGPFLADLGFGNLTPTAPLRLQADLEQETPHETMRFLAVGDELLLQARRSDAWVNLYRLCNAIPLDADIEVSNWFVSTHPNSLFVANMIAARPGRDGVRHTFLNGRVSRRSADGTVQRTQLASAAEATTVLRESFALELPDELVERAWEELRRRDRLAADHAFFQG